MITNILPPFFCFTLYIHKQCSTGGSGREDWPRSLLCSKKLAYNWFVVTVTFPGLKISQKCSCGWSSVLDLLRSLQDSPKPLAQLTKEKEGEQQGLLSLTAQRAACETWNVHPSYWGSVTLGPNFMGTGSFPAKMLISFDR